MHIHYLQHASFEGISCLKPWIETNGHSLSGTQFFANNTLPSIESFDWLIIMGGPMSVHDTEDHPWLTEEKAFIKSAIEADKLVLGICLGAQLIADVLGAKVTKNAYREIGWFPVYSREVDNTFLENLVPESINTFHWHGDTFAIPEGAAHIFSSEACENQGFIYREKVVGLQCHFETNQTFVEHLITNCADEMDNSKYVQQKESLFVEPQTYKESNAILEIILSEMGKLTGN